MTHKPQRTMAAVLLTVALSCAACGGGSDAAPASSAVDADLDGILDSTDKFLNDTDNDASPNDQDADDDNDGVLDPSDAFPLDPQESLDTDHDGIGNHADTDDDGDGILDGSDVFPLDPHESQDTNHNTVGDNADPDDDSDGFSDKVDLAPKDKTHAGDHDGDGVDSLTDADDDNDGYLDSTEFSEGSNPLDAGSKPADADNDGLTNLEEMAFGSNPNSADSDGDGLVDKVEFALKTNPNSKDSDGDSLTDAAEVGADLSNLPDADKDGTIDALDSYFVISFRTLEANPTTSAYRFGVAGDASGNRYVADYNDNIIRRFDAQGNALGPWTSFGGVSLKYVSDVAVSASSIFVADTGNDRILKLDFNGTLLQTFSHQPDGTAGGFVSPRGIDSDAEGNLWVADTWNNRIQKYDAAKNQWQAFGQKGDAVGDYLNPQDVAIAPNGTVAVADTGNERVQVVTPNGEVVLLISATTLKLAPFSFVPRSVAFNAQGQLFVVDEFSARVWVLDGKGGVVRSFGGIGAGSAQFTYPCGIFIDSEGKVVVTDRSRIQVF